MSMQNGIFVPDDWPKIIFNPVVWVRFPHMLLAAYLTGAFCVAATGAWYLLRNIYQRRGACHASHGPVPRGRARAGADSCSDIWSAITSTSYQPAKFAAIEARWHDEQPAAEVLIAIPDEATQSNRYEIKIPVLGSIIASMSLRPRRKSG